MEVRTMFYRFVRCADLRLYQEQYSLSLGSSWEGHSVTLNPKDPLKDLLNEFLSHTKKTSLTFTPERTPITTKTTPRVQRYPDLNIQICSNTPLKNIGIIHPF